MIYFLRDKDNNTIIETECWVKTDYNSDGSKHEYVEISSSVDVMHYSSYLLELGKSEEALDFIITINALSELRRWLWESFFMVNDNTPNKLDDVRAKISEFYSDSAKNLNLNFVTD